MEPEDIVRKQITDFNSEFLKKFGRWLSNMGIIWIVVTLVAYIVFFPRHMPSFNLPMFLKDIIIFVYFGKVIYDMRRLEDPKPSEDHRDFVSAMKYFTLYSLVTIVLMFLQIMVFGFKHFYYFDPVYFLQFASLIFSFMILLVRMIGNTSVLMFHNPLFENGEPHTFTKVETDNKGSTKITKVSVHVDNNESKP